MGSSNQAQPPFMSTNFQSIEDFVKEQEALDAEKSAAMKARAEELLSKANAKSKPKTKVKRVEVDVEAIAAEARAVAALGDTNWAGRLLEYRNVHPVLVDGHFIQPNDPESIHYKEVPTGNARFRYTVSIRECDHVFYDAQLFIKKKDAKQHVSKLAIEWLIENKFMPGDGSVRFPKAAPTPMPKKPNPPKGESSASQVVQLCLKLGFGMPKYVIERTSHAAPLYKGYATFQGDPRIEETEIGMVTDAYGQKSAKESIAKEVLSFLKDIERHRSEMFDEDDKKRKRSLLESPTKGESAEKMVKVA